MSILSRIAAVVGDTVPGVWDVEMSQSRTLAIWQALGEGASVQLGDLLRNPSSRQDQLACIPLLLKRNQEEILAPDNDTPLRDGDRIVFCGEAQARRQQMLTGNEAPGGLVWRRPAGVRGFRP